MLDWVVTADMNNKLKPQRLLKRPVMFISHVDKQKGSKAVSEGERKIRVYLGTCLSQPVQLLWCRCQSGTGRNISQDFTWTQTRLPSAVGKVNASLKWNPHCLILMDQELKPLNSLSPQRKEIQKVHMQWGFKIKTG